MTSTLLATSCMLWLRFIPMTLVEKVGRMIACRIQSKEMSLRMCKRKIKRNFDKPDEASSCASAPPPPASGEAIQKWKRSWRNNKVWRRENFDKPDEASSCASAPPPPASGEATQKRKRSWKNNRVWRRENFDKPDEASSCASAPPPPASGEAIQKRKRSWRKNRVWRRENFDKADEVSSRGSAPPPLASGDAIQKRKRSWKNNRVWRREHEPQKFWHVNRVWRRDRVWRRENQSQLQQQSSLPVGHKVIANQVQIQQLKSSSPAKVLKDPEPNQPEPPGFLRRYWCVNRVWRRDREWRREEHTPVDPPLEVATSTQSPGACLDPPSDQKKSVSITTTDNEVTVGKKQQGQKAKGDTDSIRRKHDSRPPPVNKDIVSGAEGKSTRKRKRPECPVVPSKRSKSDKSVSFEAEMQCLIQGFSALCL